MRAHGIRSYHRPSNLEEALRLAGQGMRPLAGGTRLLAADGEVPNVLDLTALGLARMEVEDDDLHLGAMVTLQDLIDSPVVTGATAGLLPAAARAQNASPMIRNMATVGGESVFAAHDSELLAALLALNAVYTVVGPEGPVEIPALRFLRDPAQDLGGGAHLVTGLFVAGVPDGTALERIAVAPSAPSIVSVAVTVSLTAEHCARARIAFTGLQTSPGRVLEAEARLEGSALAPRDLARCLEQIELRAPFRDDAHASAGYRRKVGVVLARRALDRAIANARAKTAPEPPRPRVPGGRRPVGNLPYFTSGRLELTVNGTSRRLDLESRTTLLDALRRAGLPGTKHGCETGECGACAVLVDGRPVLSCLTLAARVEGRTVLSVEGLGTPDALHPIQQAFVDSGAIQCGYCTPAMELCAKALLDAVPQPTETDVREALAGCLCRCTGYVKPVEAVLAAAKERTPAG